MTYRNSTYTAFYVDENYFNTNLGAFIAEDFCYFQILKSWKQNDSSFAFIDAHDKTYNVRDGSNWESTLKPRLHERLRMSKNMILILSEKTKQSRALKEEIVYGIDALRLPIIVAYPNINFIGHKLHLSNKVIERWDNLPAFRERIEKIPTAHIPFKKEYFSKAFADPRFSITTKTENCCVGLNSKFEEEMTEFTKKLFSKTY